MSDNRKKAVAAPAVPAAKPKGNPRVKYTGIPTAYYEALEAIGKKEERPVAYYAKHAIREWLLKNNHEVPEV